MHWKETRMLFCRGRAGPIGEMGKGSTEEMLVQEEQLMMQDPSMEMHWRTAGSEWAQAPNTEHISILSITITLLNLGQGSWNYSLPLARQPLGNTMEEGCCPDSLRPIQKHSQNPVGWSLSMHLMIWPPASKMCSLEQGSVSAPCLSGQLRAGSALGAEQHLGLILAAWRRP